MSTRHFSRMLRCMCISPSVPRAQRTSSAGPREAQMAAILQLSQYCTFTRDSISTVITEPGQPVSHCGPSATLPSPAGACSISSSLTCLKTPPSPSTMPSCQLKASGAVNRNGFAPEVSVQKVIQVISAILMTTVASAMQLKAFLSNSFFWPNPPTLDLMEKGQLTTLQISLEITGAPLSPP